MASRQIYAGRVVQLHLETVTLPNGHTIELEIVRHPGAAAAVPLTAQGHVLLIRQYRHAAGGYILEIPAGKLDPGEDPRHCAGRELEEEIGYRAGRLEPLLSIYTTPGFTDEVIYLFLATDLAAARQVLDADEVLDVVEMTLEDAVEAIRTGDIRDAKTIVGLQAAWLRQRASRGSQPASVRALTASDRDAALEVINRSARWYQEFLPAQECRDPEMTAEEWEAEAHRMAWYGAFTAGRLVGVMGLERLRDAALLRHGYVLPEYQRQGIGTLLREYLESQARDLARIIVGTYAKNYKARRSLEKAGYALSADSGAVLRQYYEIPEERLQASVTYEKSV
ncbi:MAG TPA: GNAT family N-acetyltransferase [Candidatus Sulfotelmatobacter sp.]|nr:GNAT family N-acetyltransferase [Candidatus Sulfotelmatobacter sp.]